MKRALTAALLPLASGCVTVLTDAERKSLSTCHETEWSAITKALVQSGHVIDHRTDDELVTVPREGRRLVVRRIDPDSFRLTIEDGGRPRPDWDVDRDMLASAQRDVCGAR